MHYRYTKLPHCLHISKGIQLVAKFYSSNPQVFLVDLYGPSLNHGYMKKKNNPFKQKKRVSLSLRFNGHFPGEPGLAVVY